MHVAALPKKMHQTTFIYIQNPHRLLACYACVKSFIFHLSYGTGKIKGEIQYFNVLLVSVPFLCTNCALKTKELLRNC